MMLCEECCEYEKNYIRINDRNYCGRCLVKYDIVSCPGEICSNLISLNGYDGLDDVDNNTCTKCNTIFCDNCIIRDSNIQLCYDCFDT